MINIIGMEQAAYHENIYDHLFYYF